MSLLIAAALAAAQPHHHHEGHAAGMTAQTHGQVEQVRQAIAKYQDFRVAKREGWKKFGGDAPLMGEHWSLDPKKGGKDYVHGMPLDFSRPSNLMYSWIDGERVLTGVSFNVRLAPGEPLPEGFAGDADQFHVHDFPKAVQAALKDRWFLRTIAPLFVPDQFLKTDGGDGRGRLAMVHVWVTIPNPDGVFASYNRLVPYRKLGLPDAYANGASMAAARGLNMVSNKGCDETIDGEAWVANLSKRVKRRLHAACDQSARTIESTLDSGNAQWINATAAIEWDRFQGLWNELLTDEQRERIAAMTDHGAHHMPDHGDREGHHGH